MPFWSNMLREVELVAIPAAGVQRCEAQQLRPVRAATGKMRSEPEGIGCRAWQDGENSFGVLFRTQWELVKGFEQA